MLRARTRYFPEIAEFHLEFFAVRLRFDRLRAQTHG